MIFYKYHGAGNDFVLIDAFNQRVQLNVEEIKRICSRHFGVGADGLITIEHDESADFNMVYYNADGHESTMCGNGGRCAVKYASSVGIFSGAACTFRTADGLHNAHLLNDGLISLQLNIEEGFDLYGQAYLIDVGSPHYVRFKHNISRLNVNVEGKMVRNSPKFNSEGINVNFVEEFSDRLFVRTYERGVESETLSCGTGVVAAALGWFYKERKRKGQRVCIDTLGGQLTVKIECDETGKIQSAWLIGPVEEVFIGEIDVVNATV